MSSLQSGVMNVSTVSKMAFGPSSWFRTYWLL